VAVTEGVTPGEGVTVGLDVGVPVGVTLGVGEAVGEGGTVGVGTGVDGGVVFTTGDTEMMGGVGCEPCCVGTGVGVPGCLPLPPCPRVGVGLAGMPREPVIVGVPLQVVTVLVIIGVIVPGTVAIAGIVD
jgi:hypothetical protein